MGRRLRKQRRVREALLLDLGALVYELHRQGKRAPELLQQKAAELTAIDNEVRDLEKALQGRASEAASEAPAQDTEEVEAAAYSEEDKQAEEDDPDLYKPLLAEHEERRA
jgi:hypothetical protein